MKEFEIDGGKIVLVKDDNKFFAVGHKCTHYGAPLAKGKVGQPKVGQNQLSNFLFRRLFEWNN